MTKRKPSMPPKPDSMLIVIAPGFDTANWRRPMTMPSIAGLTIRTEDGEFHAAPVDGMPGYVKIGKPKRPARRKRA
jgi:hypothetical protein